jgi:hypothetical protein
VKVWHVLWTIDGRRAFGPGYQGPASEERDKAFDNEAAALAWVKELKENQPVGNVRLVVEESF